MSAKAPLGKVNIGSTVGQVSFFLLFDHQEVATKEWGISDAKSLQHPFPDDKVKSWQQGTDTHYNNAFLMLAHSSSALALLLGST